MHGTTPSIYKPVLKAFTLGGNAAAYGASTDTGAGWVYKGDNGFAISSNVVSKGKTTQEDANENYLESGLFTNESKTSWATQVGLTKDQWSVSGIVNLKYNDWGDSYFSTATGDDRNENSTNYGLRAWWRPLETGTATPEVTFGYDYSVLDGYDTNDTTDAFFVGLTW